MIVRKLRAEMPWSIEAIIDSGNATPEIMAEYEAMQAAARARWMARPLRVRVYWTIRARLMVLRRDLADALIRRLGGRA